MTTEHQESASPKGRDFREAVAQWRQAVHSEVKQTSSLPTAMFDATDPMLEMRLAETTEAMLAQLLMPDPHLTADSNGAERRLEEIGAEELRRLPTMIAERPEVKLDLLSNLTGEYLGILADSCCMQDGTARQRAAEHICTDFGVEAGNIEKMLGELHRLTLEADTDAELGREREDVQRAVDRVAEVLRGYIDDASPDGGQA